MKDNKVSSFFCLVLYAIYPIMALYAYNVEQLKLSQAVLPLMITLTLAGIVYVMMRYIMKNSTKACITGAVLLVLFWHYGVIADFFSKWPVIGHAMLMPALFIAYLVFVFFVKKIEKLQNLQNTKTILLVPVSLLVAFNLFSVVSGEIKKSTTTYTLNNTGFSTAYGKGEYPDIYLLLFDEYAALPTMEEVWGYDNSAFAKRMEEKGFFFARNSQTRFVYTHMAIPTIMNLDYPAEDISRTESLLKYENNLVFRHLHQLGYQIHFLDGWGSFEYALSTPLEDFVCLYNTDYGPAYLLDEFSYMVFSRSMLMFFTARMIDANANLYYQAHNYFFDYIESFPKRQNPESKPRLLWAHVMAPHLPFVFDREGGFNENPTNYWEYRDLSPETLRELYLQQYIYVTRRIDEMTTAILDNSESEPVIILLSDHGPRRSSAGVADPRHHHRVLNAIYFPGREYPELHDSIAPVNTMRILFNKFFGTDYDMLDDI